MHISRNLVGKANPMGMNLNPDFKSGFSKFNMTKRGIGLMAIGDHSGKYVSEREAIGIQVTNSKQWIKVFGM
jgi:hypothetical protein